jgi:RimJ/RimL family protein N-acetyltransferase
MMDYSIQNALSFSLLERACDLPVKPVLVTLEGKYVRLVPLDLARDAEPLFAISNGSAIELSDRKIGAYDPGQQIWQYMSSGPFTDVHELRAFLGPQITAENGLCFCVFDCNTDKQIGVANYMNNFPMHLKIELGSIWYSPIAQGTKANLEATYMMLKHAFNLGYRRVEWKCDSRNERSRRAALRMGFKFEGIQEYHLIVKAQNRDTAWFRILDYEWEAVQIHLERLLAISR